MTRQLQQLSCDDDMTLLTSDSVIRDTTEGCFNAAFDIDSDDVIS